MARQDDHTPAPPPRPRDRSDQLSPGHALQESLGASGSQRVGDNGPLGNPVVSFPDEPDADRADAADSEEGG
jgi:hypothetical protein